MKANKFLKPLTVTVACVVAIGFLLLLVDEGTITGKITAGTGTASTAVPLSFLILDFILYFYGCICK